MSGPRTFALVTLGALLIVPKTGWFVRNHVDVLAGRWGSMANVMGAQDPRDFSPIWAYREGAMADPVASSLAEHWGREETAQARDARFDTALADPLIRSKARGPLLRQAFRSLVRPETLSRRTVEAEALLRRKAERVLPLAIEGEREEPDNAFYPSCRWVIESILEHPKEADEALARASKSRYYEDFAFEESRLVIEGFERQYGYRGNAFRLTEDMSILLPQYAALSRATQNLAKTSSLNDPRRLQAMHLGALLVRTSTTSIGVIVGQSLIGRASASGDDKLDIGHLRENVANYAKANPSIDVDELLSLMARQPTWPETTDYDAVVSSPAPKTGAALLVALLACALFARNGATPAGGPIAKRIRTAHWSLLTAVPAAFLDGGGNATALAFGFATAGIGGYFLSKRPKGWRFSVALSLLVSLVGAIAAFAFGRFQPAWLVPLVTLGASLLLPERFRWVGWTMATTLVGAGVVSATHGDLMSLLIVFLIACLAVRKAIPSSKGLEWAGAVCAGLYLLTVGWNLRLDTQQGEVREAFRTEADRYRSGAGIAASTALNPSDVVSHPGALAWRR